MARHWVILMRRDRWQVWADAPQPVGEILLEEGATEKAADQLIAWLGEHDYAGEAVTLAPSSPACLCASITCEDLPRRQSHQAMLYRLEEKMPLASEQVVADFISVGDEALGICLQSENWDPLIRAFKAAGVAVDLICPAPFLALQHLVESGQAPECDALVWVDEDAVEWFVLHDNRPQRWHALPADAGDLQLQLRLLTAQRNAPLRVALCADASSPFKARLEAIEAVHVVNCQPVCLPEAAVRAARTIQDGKRPAWINLCRQTLAAASPVGQLRTPVRAAAVAMIALWACVIGTMLWRASHYQDIQSAQQAEQKQIYENLFPDSPLPSSQSVKIRLQSERTRLAGLRRSDQPTQSSQSLPTSVLPLLHGTLQAAPADLRYRVRELVMDEASLHFQGLVNSHSDADTFATAVEKGTGWDMQPPRTELLPNGSVGFTLRGEPAPPTTTASKE